MKKAVEKEKKKNVNTYLIVGIVFVVLVGIILLVLKGPLKSFGSNNQEDLKPTEISGTELIENKEKYEGEYVRLLNVLVPDPLFAYIDKTSGGKERLFIEPRKTTYCLRFNLDGKLQKDVTGNKGWIFHVSNSTCVDSN